MQLDADGVEADIITRLRGLTFPQEVRDRVRADLATMVTDERKQMVMNRLREAREAQRTLLDLLLARQIERAVYSERYQATERIVHECERELAMPTEVERSIQQLSTLGEMIAAMSPDRQKRAIHHLFERIELSADGAVIAADWHRWARDVWDELRRVYRPATYRGSATSQTMPKVGVHHNVCGVKPPSAPPTAPPIPAPLLFWARLPATSPHS